MTLDKALQNLSDTAANPDATEDAFSAAVADVLRATEPEPQVFSSPSHDFSDWYR